MIDLSILQPYLTASSGHWPSWVIESTHQVWLSHAKRHLSKSWHACRLLLVYSDPKKAGSTLAILDGAQLQELSTPYTSFGSLSLGTAGPHSQPSTDWTLPESSILHCCL